jgi:hypothetical protein
MNDEEKFFQIKTYVATLQGRFILIYQGRETADGLEFKWIRAATPEQEQKTRDEHDQLAAKYKEVALNAYQLKQDYVLNEHIPDQASPERPWCGFKIPLELE